MVVSFGMHCPRKLRHQTVYSHLKRYINKARRNFKEPLLQTVLSSEVYIVYFVLICTLYELSFVFYMNCHTLIVYGGNYVSHLWTFTSENGFCVFRVFYVLKLDESTARRHLKSPQSESGRSLHLTFGPLLAET